MNLGAPDNCNFGQQPNLALSFGRQQFAGRIWSYFDFDKVIRDTLQDDVVIQNVKETSPYFGGSSLSFDNTVANTLYHQLLRTTYTTKLLYKRMSTIRDTYIVDLALQLLVNDALAPDPFTGEIFKIICNDEHPESKRANRLIEQFMEHFQVNRIIEKIAPDAIFWGEYSMTIQTNKGTDKGEYQGQPGVGITKIVDASPPGTIFGMFEGVHPKYFMRLKKGINTTVQGQMERLEPTSVWHIGVFPQYVDFSLGYGNMYYDDSNVIGQKFQIGRPLFYSAYDQVLELYAFERAQWEKEYGDLRRRGLVSVQAPSGLDLNGMREFTRFYEKILNDTSGPTSMGDLQGLDAINAQMATLSNVRVIPTQPDRGKMDVVDLKIAADNLMEKINDRRKIILESRGIPYDYALGARDGGKVNIRQHVVYARRLAQIQNGFGLSLQRLIRTHLINSGIYVSLKDIKINFYKTVNVATLEAMEAMDTRVAFLANFDDRMAQWRQDPIIAKYINVSEYMRFIDKSVTEVDGTGNIFIVPPGENLMGDVALQQAQAMTPQDPNAQTAPPPATAPMQTPPIPPQGAAGISPNGLPPGVKTSGGGLPVNVKTSGGQLPPNVRINS